MQKNEIGPHTKTNLKWIKDLKVRPKTMSLLKENIGSNLCDIGIFDDFFSDVISKVKATKQEKTSGITSN